jgi:hypothetical protein
LHNSALIHPTDLGVSYHFFSSSVCVYCDMLPSKPEMTETEVIYSRRDNEYGWESSTASTYCLPTRSYTAVTRVSRIAMRGKHVNRRMRKASAAICRKLVGVTGRTAHIYGETRYFSNARIYSIGWESKFRSRRQNPL